MTIFDILNNILKYKSDEEYNKHISSSDFYKIYNQYMINRWLSMCDKVDVIDTLFQYQKILENIKIPELHYKLLIKIMPKHKFCNLKYIK
jgi:hypothetical protein